MHVSVALIRAFADCLHRLGVSAERFCVEASFDPARLADPTAMVSVAEYGRLLESALRLSEDPAFALHVGESAPSGALHTVGYLLVNCTTMRDAIAQFVTHAELIYEDARWELTEVDVRATFTYDHRAVASCSALVAALDAEFCLAHIVGVGRNFAGRDIAPREVRFRHAAPAHIAEYEHVFRCPVVFEQPHNEVVFKRKLLDVPHLHRDEPVAQLLRQRAHALLAERQSDHRLRQRLVDIIKYQPDLESVDAGHLARQLGMGPRTLRRRLATLQVSLFTLIEQARSELACDALSCDTPIKEIAARLGFSEVSAFHRAFKRWTGVTPGQYRTDQRSRSAS